MHSSTGYSTEDWLTAESKPFSTLYGVIIARNWNTLHQRRPNDLHLLIPTSSPRFWLPISFIHWALTGCFYVVGRFMGHCYRMNKTNTVCPPGVFIRWRIVRKERTTSERRCGYWWHSPHLHCDPSTSPLGRRQIVQYKLPIMKVSP